MIFVSQYDNSISHPDHLTKTGISLVRAHPELLPSSQGRVFPDKIFDATIYIRHWYDVLLQSMLFHVLHYSVHR
jgi:hypothetical protein